MALVLKITEGDNKTDLFLTKRPRSLGRSSKCHIKLSDSMVSGTHFEASISEEGRALVKDLGSTNGTYINGSKITKTHIYLDDLIHIGEVRISLDKKKMNPKEVDLHSRGYERTEVTFIDMREQTNSTKKAKEVDFDEVQEEENEEYEECEEDEEYEEFEYQKENLVESKSLKKSKKKKKKKSFISKLLSFFRK